MNKRPLPRAIAVLFMLSLITGRATAQDEWPGFRGAEGSAIANVALDVDTLAPEVVWRVSIGSGYSGVAIADGRAVVMHEKADGQYLLALDAATGEQLWEHRVADRYPGHDGSWDGPVSTPLIHEGVVVGLEPWGRLVAVDALDGEPMWSVHLADDLGAPKPVYGFGSSPTAIGETVVINAAGDAGTLLGFDLHTGEQRWKISTEGAMAQSPIPMTFGGQAQIVGAGNQSVFGIDPATGDVIWEFAHEGGGPRGAMSMVPVQVEQGVFLTHHGDRSRLIAIDADGEAANVLPVWESRTLRSSYMPTAYHDGYIYGYNLRILTCMDAATGERVWRSRNPGDGFVTIIDGHLLVLTKDGTLHIARATPDGYDELVGVPIFDALTWTAPSVAYGDVFARSGDEIARIDLNGGGSRAIATDDLKVARSLDPGDGEFGQFIRAVEAADDPAALIDEFFAAQRAYPIHEGETRVHFVYRGEATDMAILGDMLGTRQDVAMERVGSTDLYYYSTELIPAARLAYAFLRDGEFITDPLNPDTEPTLIFNAEREHVFGDRPLVMSEVRMPGWEPPAHLREPDPAHRGSTETLTLATRRGDVDWHVYLPRGYAESADRYPVVYYHGPSPTDLSRIPTTLDNLIADGMQPVIAVWSGRMLGAGPPYSRFWAETLVPAVDSGYRTIAGAEGRVAYGGGLGALAGLQVAVDYPDMTSALGMSSIRALDIQWDPLLARFGTPESQPMRLYVDWGAYGVRNPQEVWDNRVKTAHRAQQLRDLGYEVAGGEINDTVGWASWRNHAARMLEALLPPDPESAPVR